jgi:ankyrin repeat protein
MTTEALKLDPVFKKFPTICGETQKIATALAAEERGARLASGFLPYASAFHKLFIESAALRKAHKGLDAALQTLSLRVQAAFAKIAPSELLIALRKNDVNTVEKILKITSLPKTLPNGEMPLHYAIRSGSSDVVKYFLCSARIDPFSRDHQGLSAFDHAYIMKNPKMIALVLGAALGTTIPESVVSSEADASELQALVQTMTQCRWPPVAKLHPLHQAAFLDDLKGLEKLSQERDLHEADENGMTALHYAVLGGKEAAVLWLLAKGAKLESKAANGMNLLHLAAINGSEAILKLLLEKKILDPNTPDRQGRTPLHFALAAEKLGVARTLSERGGDPLVKTMRTTPLAIFNQLSRIKADLRDPLKLDTTSLYILGSFAASSICHYFGKANAKDFRQYLPLAGNVLNALPILGTLYNKARSHSLLAIPASFAFSTALTWGYLLGDQSTKSYVNGGHTLILGKTLFDNLRISWKNSALETYRPLRNVFVHSANALFSAWEFLKATGIKKRLFCQFGTHEQCISQDGLKLKYVQPKECGGLENGVTDDLVNAHCKDLKICNDLKIREEKINACLETSDLEKKIKGICEKKLNTTEEKIEKMSCTGLSEGACAKAQHKAYADLKNCKALLKEEACERFFPSEDSETCRTRLGKEAEQNQVACERTFPMPLEDTATCKARIKSELETLANLCRANALETSADAKMILDLSGESNPEKAKQILFAEFPNNQKIQRKIEQAFNTIKNPPPPFGLSKEYLAAMSLFDLKEGFDPGEECKKAFKNLSRKCHPDKISRNPELKATCPDQSTVYAAKDLLCQQ